jgi:hypothetical protein
LGRSLAHLVWSFFNGTWLSLLSIIPGIHFIMMFVLSAKGNEWVWATKTGKVLSSFTRQK